MHDPVACLRASEKAPFVSEALVAPLDGATARAARKAGEGLRKVRILPPGDTGLYSAWNKMVAATRTTHVAFHGVDDLVDADPAIGTALADVGPRDMLVFSIRFATPTGTPTAIYHHRETEPPALSLGRYANPACPEVAWPVAVLRDLGGLDESFRIAGDAELYFRVRPHVVRRDRDLVLLTMLDGGLSVAARNAASVWRENRRIARRYGQRVPLSNLVSAGLFLHGRHLASRAFGAKTADRATDAVRAVFGKPPRYSLMHAP